MPLPTDGHVHTEWSWDTDTGSMERSCARAVAIGLPSIAFTEHLDHTAWDVEPSEVDGHLASLVYDGRLVPPAFDADGYLASVERCRHIFPSLRILSGVEVGEPHWHGDAVATVLSSGTFDRVLGSQHCLPHRDGYAEPPLLFADRDAGEVVRSYLAEVVRLVSSDEPFAVLAHIDYPFRAWPHAAGPLVVGDFEEELRAALAATAASGRALELNTRLPLDALVLGWWRDVGGDALTFGSDAHQPDLVARGFAEAADLAAAYGFRPGPDPIGVWVRG